MRFGSFHRIKIWEAAHSVFISFQCCLRLKRQFLFEVVCSLCMRSCNLTLIEWFWNCNSSWNLLCWDYKDLSDAYVTWHAEVCLVSVFQLAQDFLCHKLKCHVNSVWDRIRNMYIQWVQRFYACVLIWGLHVFVIKCVCVLQSVSMCAVTVFFDVCVCLFSCSLSQTLGTS